MKKYTVYTEDLGNIGKLTSQFFEGFTLSQSVGFWKGKEEKSIKVDVFTDDAYSVHQLAETIKYENKQEAVLVEFPDGEGVLV